MEELLTQKAPDLYEELQDKLVTDENPVAVDLSQSELLPKTDCS